MEEEDEEIADPDENTFRILVVTDTHLGVFEKDPIRSKDSFRDAHVKTFLRVVFLGFFDSKWCYFFSNYRIGTFDTAFES